MKQLWGKFSSVLDVNFEMTNAHLSGDYKRSIWYHILMLVRYFFLN